MDNVSPLLPTLQKRIQNILDTGADVIWGQSLCSSDWGMEQQYQGAVYTPCHTPALLNRKDT